MQIVPTTALPGNAEIPKIGLGLARVPTENASEAVLTALEVGYRSIDTATSYGNEAGVGTAIARSDLPRGEIFVTTKLDDPDHGYQRTLRACATSLRVMCLEYLDLYLIHWPVPAQNLYVESWRALIKLQQDGIVRAIGVSNFLPEHVRRLIDETGVTPAVNQIEVHPYFTQRPLRRFHTANGVVTEAYSPLAKGRAITGDRLITKLAEIHDKTPAQIVLRWHMETGNVAIPKSTNRNRMTENLNVFDFELQDADLDAIEALHDDSARIGSSPEIGRRRKT